MTEVVIASAARTPVGAFNGSLSSVPAHYLGEVAIKEALNRAGVSPDEVDEVLMGQILSAGAGQNPARQAAVNAGIPESATAVGVNQLCGSGLRTVALGMQFIQLGDANIMVCGGQESMSQAPHTAHMRGGTKMGPLKMNDSMLQDGLTCSINGYHMGNTAENIAQQWQLTREEQDAFAVSSQNKAEAAQKAGKFADEIAPVTIKTRKGEIVVDTDEHPRLGTTAEALAGLKAPFREGGTVTAGNASGVNDGACALIVASEEAANKHGLTPKARVVAMATAGVEPRIMGFGPAPATHKLMAMTGLKVADMDVIELNEAFAAQGLAVTRDLGLPDDAEHVNPNGGAIALGHPLGMSGARLATTATYQLHRTGGKYALATMCIGVGQGIAMVIERV